MIPALETLNLPADLREALEAAVQAIVEAADPEAVILFGSFAEGTADEESDVDLLVVAETEDRYRLAMRLVDVARQLLRPRGLDLLVMLSSEWPRARTLRGFVGWEADQYGVKLYGRAA